MNSMQAQVQPGWAVVGSDGGKVGKVTAVREDHLVVEHGLINKQSLYVPVDAVTGASDDTVTLNLGSAQVAEQGWQVPPSAPHERNLPAYPEVPETTMIQAAGYSSGSLSAPEAQGFVRNSDETTENEQLPNALYNPEGEDRPD